MYFSFVVARPRHVGLARLERHADGVDARHELAVGAEHVERALAHAGHDPHARRDVRRVGELDADVRDRRAERPHRERDHVERAAAHRARVEAQHLGAHLGRVAPVVGGAGVVSALAADEGAVLDAGDVAGIAARVEAVRPRRRVDRIERARLDERRGAGASYSSSEPSHQCTRSGSRMRRPAVDPRRAACGGPSAERSRAGSCSSQRCESFEVARVAHAVTEAKRTGYEIVGRPRRVCRNGPVPPGRMSLEGEPAAGSARGARDYDAAIPPRGAMR